MNLNNKGVTIIEVVLSFTLIMIMATSMLIIIVNYRNKAQLSIEKTKMNTFKNTLTLDIQKDIQTLGLQEINSDGECTKLDLSSCINLVFYDGSEKAFGISKLSANNRSSIENKYLYYDGIKYKLHEELPADDKIPAGRNYIDLQSIVIEDNIVLTSTSTILEDGHNVTIYSIDVDISHVNFKQDFGIHITATTEKAGPGITATLTSYYETESNFYFPSIEFTFSDNGSSYYKNADATITTSNSELASKYTTGNMHPVKKVLRIPSLFDEIEILKNGYAIIEVNAYARNGARTTEKYVLAVTYIPEKCEISPEAVPFNCLNYLTPDEFPDYAKNNNLVKIDAATKRGYGIGKMNHPFSDEISIIGLIEYHVINHIDVKAFKTVYPDLYEKTFPSSSTHFSIHVALNKIQ